MYVLFLEKNSSKNRSKLFFFNRHYSLTMVPLTALRLEPSSKDTDQAVPRAVRNVLCLFKLFIYFESEREGVREGQSKGETES